MAVIVDGVFSPNALGLGTFGYSEKLGGTAPGPLVPAGDVSVVDGVVVDVVEGGEIVAFGTHGAVGGTIEDLSTAGGFFAVPVEGRAAVKAAEIVEEIAKAVGGQ